MPNDSRYSPAVANTRQNLDSYAADFMARRKAAGQFGPDPALNQAALHADEGYQKLLAAHQQSQSAHVFETNQPEFAGLQGAAQYAVNQAAAVPIDAQTRRQDADTRRVVGQGQAIRETGLGNLYNRQADNVAYQAPSEQAARIAVANATNSEADVNRANASRTAALLPYEQGEAAVRINDANALRPGKLTQQGLQNQGIAIQNQGAAQDNQLKPDLLKAQLEANRRAKELENAKTQSEIDKNSIVVDPNVGPVDSRTGKPIYTPPPNAAPAPERGFLSKTWDAIKGGFGFGGEGNPALNMALPGRSGWIGAARGFMNGTAPQPALAPAAAAPLPSGGGGQMLKLPDGRTIEKVGNLVYQVMPDGTRRLLQVQ